MVGFMGDTNLAGQ